MFPPLCPHARPVHLFCPVIEFWKLDGGILLIAGWDIELHICVHGFVDTSSIDLCTGICIMCGTELLVTILSLSVVILECECSMLPADLCLQQTLGTGGDLDFDIFRALLELSFIHLHDLFIT